jgi:hypothetical protein
MEFFLQAFHNATLPELPSVAPSKSPSVVSRSFAAASKEMQGTSQS